MHGSGRPGITARTLLSALLTGALLATPGAAAAAQDTPPDPSAPQNTAGSQDEPGAVPATGLDSGSPEAAGAMEKPYWRRNFFGRFFSDQKYLFTDWLPAEVHRQGFTIPMVVGTGLAVAGSRDADGSHPELTFERDLSSDTSGSSEATAHLFTTLGDGATGMLLIGTAYLAGRFSGHDRFAESASLSAEAVLDAGLWVTVLKGVTARTRPSGGGTGEFLQYNPPPGQHAESFPSGHAAGAFAAASIFAGMYREQHPWVPWVAYGTATLVGASRLALGRHFPTDVVVGGVLGDSFGRMVLSRRGPEGRVASSTIMPFYDPTLREEGVAWRREW